MYCASGTRMSDQLIRVGRLVSGAVQTGGRTPELREKLRGFPVALHFFSLTDQAVVSGVSFLTTVLVGRWSSPSELGRYSIAMSLLLVAVGVQESLITLPYIIQRHRPGIGASDHAGGALVLCGLLSALIVAMAATVLVLLPESVARPIIALAWIAAGSVPFMLIREFARQYAFAHLRVSQALILDLATALFQIAGLTGVAWAGRLSAATASAAIGAGCIVTATAWLFLNREKFTFCRSQLSAISRQSWKLGRWLFAGQITVSIQAYVASWVLGFTAGAAAVGVYAACMSIASLSNPLVNGFGNVLRARAVICLHEGGIKDLRRQAASDALLLGLAMACFCAIVMLAGNNVLRVLYRGSDFAAQRATITILALALSAAAIGIPASNALAAVERPRAIFWAGLAGAALTAIAGYWFAATEGARGAAYGFLIGNIVGAAGRWAAFLAVASRPAARSVA